MMLNSHENTVFKKNLSLNLNGELMDLSTPKVMGIINLTPDSFYSESRKRKSTDLLTAVEKMIAEGVDIIDLGAFSSRPGAELISEEQEQKRLIEALPLIKKEFPMLTLSVDTYRSSIATLCADYGVAIINDISGGLFDDKMFETVGKNMLAYILMHMPGKPKNMQQNTTYENVVTDLFYFFSQQLKQLKKQLVNDIILDPGFGFGKNQDQNYTILKNLAHFQKLGCPLIVGLSRKKMIQELIEKDASEALNGTTAANVIALLNGANLLRVHDVAAAKEAVSIVDYYQKR